MRITDHRKARDIIRKQISLHEFIESQDIDLHKAGKGWKILCPFHSEKGPSFTISEYEGWERYYCFGCHRKGDIIDFVKEKMLVDTEYAIQYLADKYHIDITSTQRKLNHEEERKEKQYGIMERVAEWLHEKLVGERGKPYEYMLYNRGIKNDGVLDKFLIGYSSTVNDLLKFINNEKLGPIDELELDRTYIWTDSIVFPVMSSTGRINRFYTRPFNPIRPDTKYVSTSSKHPLFDPSDSMFGFYQVKNSSIRHEMGIIAVEGHIDCLAMHSVGLDNTVALAGSKLEQPAINNLSKLGIHRLSLIFDGDDAGKNAAIKLTTDDIDSHSVEIRLNTMPDGLDPDSFLQSNDLEEMTKIVKNARSASIYYVDVLASNYSLPDSMESLTFISDISRYLQQTKSANRTLIIRRIAELIKLNEDDVANYLSLNSSEESLIDPHIECSLIRQLIEDSNNELVGEIATQVDVRDFAISWNRYLFQKIMERHTINKSVSVEWLKRQAIIEDHRVIAEFIDNSIANARILDAKWCIEELVDKARRRRTIQVSNGTISKAYDLKQPIASTVEEMAGAVSTLIYSEENNDNTRLALFQKAEVLYDERRKKDSIILGYPFGDRWLTSNDLVSGLEKGKTLLIMASTGVGKTNLALNWSVDWTVNVPEGFDPAKVLYIPIEMQPEQLQFRSWAIHSGVGAKKIERGLNLTEEEEYELTMTKEILRDFGPIIKRPRVNTLSAVLYEINYWKAKEDIDIVVVDYIQRLAPCELTGRRDDWDRYDFTAMTLCDRAQLRGDIAMVVLSQQSDESKKAGIEAEGGTSRAKSIPNHFDYSCIIVRKTMKQIEQHGAQYGNRFIKWDKNRFGLDQFTIHAHLFNHQRPDLPDPQFGSLRMGEVEAMKRIKLPNGKTMDSDIQVSGTMTGMAI